MLNEARAQALQIVLDASRSEDPRARAAALEAIQPEADRAQTMALIALEDESASVRFAALVTIGQLQHERLGQAALDLAHDDNDSVRGAAVFAAQRCGVDVGEQLSILAQMLGHRDPGVRGNGAMLLGMLGDDSAVPMLEEMMKLPMPRIDPADRIWLQLQFAQALLEINPDDEEMLDLVRTSVFSTIDDVRVLSLQVVGQVRDRRMIGAMESMMGHAHDPIQIRIAAARSLALMGNQRGQLTLMTAAAYSSENVLAQVRDYLRAHRDSNTREADYMRQLAQSELLRDDIAADVRAQSAFGLGLLNDMDSARKLVEMLDDPHPIVQLASSAALLEALSR